MVCAQLKPAVSGLEQDFPGKVKAENVDASGEAARKDIKELGFKNHGLVIRDAKGNVVHKQPDHSVDIDAAKKAIQDILAKQK